MPPTTIRSMYTPISFSTAYHGAPGRNTVTKRGDWAREIQPIVNELCREYGLSIQDIEVGAKEKTLKKWDKTKQGIFKWNHQIRLDVEDSISFATSYENFLKLVELKGYGVRQKDGEAYLKPMGEKNALSGLLIFQRTIPKRRLKPVWIKASGMG